MGMFVDFGGAGLRSTDVGREKLSGGTTINVTSRVICTTGSANTTEIHNTSRAESLGCVVLVARGGTNSDATVSVDLIQKVLLCLSHVC